MADLTVTAANVAATAGATIEHHTAGASLTAGQVVYIDTSNTAQLCDADLSDAAAAAKGIALHASATGQPIAIATAGDVDVGATVTVGEIYVASGTAGGIAPVGDFAAGDRATILGVGTAADNLRLRIFASGITRAA